MPADRSRIHGLDDAGVQDHRPKEWNKTLFDQLVSSAWAKLLRNICQDNPTEDHSHLWPPTSSDTRQLWDGMCRAVIDQVAVEQSPVWFTDVGYVVLEKGLLASRGVNSKMRRALHEAQLPIIFLAEHVLHEAGRIPGSRKLGPSTLYQSLKDEKRVDSISSQSRIVLLEYLLQDIPLADLGLLELFPFQDGLFHALKPQKVFLHCDDLEKALFAHQQESTIDTDLLSEHASTLLHTRAKLNDGMVRYRNPEDLRDYYLANIGKGSTDIIGLDEDLKSKVIQVWTWILQHSQGELPLSILGSLWLVPLQGAKLRKLVPMNDSSYATWFRSSEVDDVWVEMLSSDSQGVLNVLSEDALSNDILHHLIDFAERQPSLLILNGNKFENFVWFLAQGRSVLEKAPGHVKTSVLRMLKQSYWRRKRLDTERVCNVLKSLCLFKAIHWPADPADVSFRRSWTHMSSGITYIGLEKLVPVPSSPKLIFIDVTDEIDRTLFKDLCLLDCWDGVRIIGDIAIPALQRGSYQGMNTTFCLDVIIQLLENYHYLPVTLRSDLSSLEIIPLNVRNADNSLNFGSPMHVLDPIKPALRGIYFDDEIKLPDEGFYERFSPVLAGCGLVKSLTEDVIRDRIRNYGRKGFEFGVVASRAQNLLELPFDSGNMSDETIRFVRETEWLPARNPFGSNSWTSSSKCRDISEKPFIDHVWHVLPFKVHQNWRSILGWEKPIDIDVLLSQLAANIRASDMDSTESTLSYIYKKHSLADYANRLLELGFVRSSNGELVHASKVCRRGGERLVPYLYTVDARFWDKYFEILKLANIPINPSLEHLKDVQKSLQSKGALAEDELDVAVEVARLWSVHYLENVWELKMPSDQSILVDIGDLVFNDRPDISGTTCAFVHPKISSTTAKRLNIEPLSEKLIKGELGITDPDDDEFYQREEITDGIRDTLDRYTRESTFHEYLANADDCGTASEVNFCVDSGSYDAKRLLTPELRDLQGPSLLIHNDGGE
jgi:sacsin